MSFHTLPLLDFRMAETLSLALLRVVTIDTALLSTVTKQGRVGAFPIAYFYFLISLPIVCFYFSIYLSYF